MQNENVLVTTSAMELVTLPLEKHQILYRGIIWLQSLVDM